MLQIQIKTLKEIKASDKLVLPRRRKPVLDLPKFPIKNFSRSKFERLPDYKHLLELSLETVEYYRIGYAKFYGNPKPAGSSNIEFDMEPLTNNLIAWRGFNTETEPYKGMRIKRSGFTSTSMSSSIASEFLKHGHNYPYKVLAKLYIPSGTYCVVSNSKEQEILLDRGSEFIITKILGQFIVGQHTDIPCYVVHANVL